MSKQSDTGSFLTPKRPAEAELREKGSRFLATVMRVDDELSAKTHLTELAKKYSDASHHCWAWRLGWPASERSTDAGEPHGTAGEPILRVLRGAGLSNTLAVVVRWFGGTKLGKGGLIRAYGGAAAAAVAELATEAVHPTVVLGVEIPYERVGALKRLVNPPQVELIEEEYGEHARVSLRVWTDRQSEIAEALAGLGVRVKTVEPSDL